MDPKPVHRYATPRYPTRRDLMLGAVGFVLIDLFADEAEAADSDKPAAGRTVVAPIFKHGEGRGATGGVVVVPPVFLSEQEAMQVIREELAKHGVKLGESIMLSEVKIAARTDIDFGEREIKRLPKPREDETSTTPLRLDGVDRMKKVAVRFVSEKAYHDLGGVWDWATVQGYDFPEVAEYVAARIEKQGKTDLSIGLFYDPAVKLSFFRNDQPERQSPRESVARTKARAEEFLRQQTRDFAAWLKQRKVL